MKRAKRIRRYGDFVRYRFAGRPGAPEETGEIPLDDAAHALARQLYGLAATILDDEERRRRLEGKAREFEQLARDALGRRAIAGEAWRKRSKGGKKTAEKRRAEAADRLKKLKKRVDSLKRAEPGAKDAYLAAVLAERGYGKASYLLKLLQNFS